MHFAHAQRPIVRLIYFIPSDRPPQSDFNAKMDMLIKEVQQFYADQMDTQGFGRKTFQIETDAAGRAVVHRVVGQFTHAHYRNLSNTWDVWNEINKTSDPTENIYLTAIDISNEILDRGRICGRGGWRGHGGMALIPASGPCFDFRTIAHELGHAFGLDHDFRDNEYIMSYGDEPTRLSKCAAEWISVRSAFNPESTQQAVSTEIKILPPVVESFPNAIRHRFEFSGVHQLQLLTETLTGPAAGSPELVSCKTLNGLPNTIVEFTGTELTSGSYLNSIDVNGNLKLLDLKIPVDHTLLYEPAKVVSIPDVNLAKMVKGALGLEPTDKLTTHNLQYLSTLKVNKVVTSLTGLEYAHNLRRLDIQSTSQYKITDGDWINLSNNVSDISPLLGITQLTKLDLRDNPLSYTSINTYIPALQRKGIEIEFDDIAHPALLKISGDAQEDLAGRILPFPFVVEAQNEYGQPIENIYVIFTIHSGSGILSQTKTQTDIDGKASTTLNLGWAPETTIIHATAENIISTVYFSANTIRLIQRAPADVNNDGIVNVEDLILVTASLGSKPVSEMLPKTDVNNDGIVNNDDVAIVLAALEAGAAAPLAVVTTGKVLTTETLTRWIAEAKRYKPNSEPFQRGILVLENLLKSLTSKGTALLPNYPNPFNPETWIPYQLSTPTDVSISIHATDGKLVRKLDLGHQVVGIYESPSQAAYWDGRNTYGEPVASDIYFYTLTAGEFTATRKMLIRK